MATLAKGYTFGATEQVTNSKLHSLVDNASISGIATADVANSAITTALIANDAVDGDKLGIMTTNGDLLVYSTKPSKLPVSTNGSVLTSDSGQSEGLGWGPIGGIPLLTFGTSTVSGSVSSKAVRVDATLPVFDTTAPTTIAFGDSASVGVIAKMARRDHGHGMAAQPGMWQFFETLDFDTGSISETSGTLNTGSDLYKVMLQLETNAEDHNAIRSTSFQMNSTATTIHSPGTAVEGFSNSLWGEIVFPRVMVGDADGGGSGGGIPFTANLMVSVGVGGGTLAHGSLTTSLQADVTSITVLTGSLQVLKGKVHIYRLTKQ